MITYELASDEKAQDFIEAAKQWHDEEGGYVMFESAGGIARTAVAEFIANRHGYTLYACKAGKRRTNETLRC